LITQSCKVPGPFYIRLSRPSVPTIYSESRKVELGKAAILREGADIGIIACGIMVNEAMEAAEALAKTGISAEVVDSHTIKPLDSTTIVRVAKKTGALVTAEEQSVIGGLGGAVVEATSESYPVPVSRVGVKDTFGESGEHQELMAKYGLTSKEITRVAKHLIESR
jgi:transketolase